MAITRFTVDTKVIDVRMNQMVDEIGSEIGQITNTGIINSKVLDGVDLNAKKASGWYFTSPSCLNIPVAGIQFYLEVHVYTNSYLVQKAITNDVSKGIYERKCISGTWTAWKEIATTEKYVMQASDMRNGWILGHGNTLQKIGNRVFVRFQIQSGVANVDTVVCNIPAGFRPVTDRVFIARAYATTNENPVNQFMTVLSDGNVQIKYTSSKPFIFIEASWEV